MNKWVKTYCLALFIGFTSLYSQDSSQLKCSNCSPELIRSMTQQHFLLSSNWNLEISGLGGFLIPHHEDMMHLYSHSIGGQFSAAKSIRCLNQNKEHQLGILLNYINSGNSIIGRGTSVAVLFRHQLNKNLHSKLSVEFALGMGYLTQKYDIVNNPENRAIGTNFNGYMQLGMRFKQTFGTSRTYFIAKASFSHFSNASWQYPNLGINIPGIQIGIGHAINVSTSKSNSQIKSPPKISLNPFSHSISLRLGKKEIDVDDQRSFLVGLVDYTLGIRRNSNSNYRISLNLFRDPSYNFEKFKPMKQSTLSNSTEVAIQLGYQTNFNRWALIFDFGYYLYKPLRTYKTAYYEGIGCAYTLNNTWKLMARLKANKTTADFAELGFVYQFKTN